MIVMKTFHLITGLSAVFQFQMSHVKINGVYCTGMWAQPDPDGTSYLNSNSHISRERRSWDSGAPGRHADNRGHHRGQHQQEDSDSDLVMEERHHKSTQTLDVDHIYYTSKIYGPGEGAGEELWVNIDKMKENEWKVHEFLSTTHRQAERVTLSFDFPFYGHILKEIVVTTGGFIYTGDVIHRMLTAAQYIAPLMANFHLSISENSTVFYFDNGTALVVQWSRIHLQDHFSAGMFTFQAILHSDGRIVFAYKQIPININDISTENHPVKVGLSDAFVVLHDIEQIPHVRRRTIYEYHKVDILKSKISNYTVVEMLPLPTCLQFSSCVPCVTSQIGFNCSWCSRLQRCSSGFDRNRQEWVDLGCMAERKDPHCVRMKNTISDQRNHMTSAVTVTVGHQRMLSTPSPVGKLPFHPSARSSGSRMSTTLPTTGQTADTPESAPQDDDRMQNGLLPGVVVVMVLVAAGVILVIYMYSHPTSSATLFFMERRPTHWPIMKFRRGSGHPSYAEVEAPGQDKDSTAGIDPKQVFVISDRRESEQKEGFIVPDQRELFLLSENC
ncbi:plexin domain-containing protein 2 [Thalassophryne amazonica]|uniref:plexin domain-containing protein 2 n=1 Tax=Thalassophryne amazonica TaxID=390379 RepID=UPI001470F80F|nr:plexin domain-containing protein 2 [Thalassophryne amazonica]